MNKSVLVKANAMEGLYINGELVEAGVKLNHAKEDRSERFTNLSKQYNFNLNEIEEYDITDDSIYSYWYEYGALPMLLSELIEKRKSK